MSLFELGSEISKFIFHNFGGKTGVLYLFVDQTNPWNFSYPNPNLNKRGSLVLQVRGWLGAFEGSEEAALENSWGLGVTVAEESEGRE